MTGRKLVLRPSAEEDLVAIYEYIAEQSGSPERALSYIHRIRTRCEQLRDFPETGRARDGIRAGVRILGFERRIVIAYTILPSGDVEIGRVFYGGRDYEALIRRDLPDDPV